MKLIEFPEQNVIIAKDQPEYLPFPAKRFLGDPTGRIVGCWRLSWRERLMVLWRGLIWQEVLTFNRPLQPQRLGAEKPDMTQSEIEGRVTDFAANTGGTPVKSLSELFAAMRHSAHAAELEDEIDKLKNEVAILQQQYAHERSERIKAEDRSGRWEAEARSNTKL